METQEDSGGSRDEMEECQGAKVEVKEAESRAEMAGFRAGMARVLPGE
jgi:hypothetical protein